MADIIDKPISIFVFDPCGVIRTNLQRILNTISYLPITGLGLMPGLEIEILSEVESGH